MRELGAAGGIGLGSRCGSWNQVCTGMYVTATYAREHEFHTNHLIFSLPLQLCSSVYSSTGRDCEYRERLRDNVTVGYAGSAA
jgi:hypothetical protein